MKNVTSIFLSVAIVGAVLISPLGVNFATAQTVTDQDISNQKTLVIESSKDAVGQYIRLLMYMLIQKLEMEVEAQNGK